MQLILIDMKKKMRKYENDNSIILVYTNCSRACLYRIKSNEKFHKIEIACMIPNNTGFFR